MAKLQATLPEDMMKKLNALAQEYDVIVPRMLRAGAKPLKKHIKKNLAAVIGHNLKAKPRSKGALIKAVKVTKVYRTANGETHVKVSIYGKDSNKVPNALKGNVLEHGREIETLEHGKSNVPAKPWLAPAVEAARDEVEKAMANTFDKEMKK